MALVSFLVKITNLQWNALKNKLNSIDNKTIAKSNLRIYVMSIVVVSRNDC